MNIRIENAHNKSLDQTLTQRKSKGDIWVYGYGSLMWNPQFEYVESKVATLRHYQRKFCFWSYSYRGTKDYPGLILGLDKGSSCCGKIFKLDKQTFRPELEKIWVREMFREGYTPVWKTVRTSSNEIEALVFLANPQSKNYVGNIPETTIIKHLATAEGKAGSSYDYLRNTVVSLQTLHLVDKEMERLLEHVHQFRKQHYM